MRTLRNVLIIVVLLVIVYLVLRSGLFRRTNTIDMALPVDLKEIIPANWDVLSDTSHFVHCDFNGDNQLDWLVIYRYDQTAVSSPYAESATQPPAPVGRSAIGGVIYDAQVNRVPQQPAIRSPYRPAFMFPYKLLPDVYPGKGQGYLGESNVTTRFSPALVAGAACRVDELAIFGFGADNPLPTRLSLFRWDGRQLAFLSQHFAGNAQVQASPALPAADPISQVVTYNRLNERSRLCEVRGYRRVAPDRVDFAEDTRFYTIDFCFGAPPDPAYPEAVVIAALRGNNPISTTLNTSPTGASYFTPAGAASVPADLASLNASARSPYQITVLENPGAFLGYPNQGAYITDTATSQVWLWGAERVAITTTLMLPAGPRAFGWRLVSIANERRLADTHWRIDQVVIP